MKKRFFGVLLLIISLKAEAQSSVFNSVDSLLVLGNYQEALAILDEEQEQTAQVLNKKGAIYQSIGNYTKSIENYNKALTIDSNLPTKVKLGKVYEAADLTLEAITIYEEIIQRDSTNLLVANSLGKLYLQLHNPRKAEQFYRFLIKNDSLNPNYHYQLAKTYAKQNEFFLMGQSYLNTYNLDTLHARSIYRLVLFYKDLNDRDSTQVFIDKGLQLKPYDFNFNQLKANQLYTAKKYDEAIGYLKKLDSLNFKSINAYEMLGMCYQHKDSLNGAEEYFKKALELDDDSTIFYRLANVYYKKGDYKKAMMNVYRSIYHGKADLYRQHYLNGILLIEEGNVPLALESFEKSYTNNPKFHKALYELAINSDAYYKDKAIALKHYQNYLRRFEDKEEAMTNHVNFRIQEIKREFFIEGKKIE